MGFYFGANGSADVDAHLAASPILGASTSEFATRVPAAAGDVREAQGPGRQLRSPADDAERQRMCPRILGEQA